MRSRDTQNIGEPSSGVKSEFGAPEQAADPAGGAPSSTEPQNSAADPNTAAPTSLQATVNENFCLGLSKIFSTYLLQGAV